MIVGVTTSRLNSCVAHDIKPTVMSPIFSRASLILLFQQSFNFTTKIGVFRSKGMWVSADTLSDTFLETKKVSQLITTSSSSILPSYPTSPTHRLLLWYVQYVHPQVTVRRDVPIIGHVPRTRVVVVVLLLESSSTTTPSL